MRAGESDCQGVRRSGLLPPRKTSWEDSEDKSGSTRQGNRGDVGTHNDQTPHGLTGTWAQAKGGKGGSKSHGKRRQMQARGVGCRDERRRMSGGRYGQRPGGRSLTP